MNINKLIIDTLQPLNIPVTLLTYGGSETTYVTFNTYLAMGEGFSEDEEELTGHYIQLNVFSITDYTDIVAQVKQLLKSIGFKRTTEIDLYEDTTKLFHKGIKYFYLENLT
jgi:uncharacterized protein (DUF302 family)